MSNSTSSRSSKWLWALQVLLALVFLMTGTMKLVLPPAKLVSPVPLPIAFVRFIGVCEIVGALGLLLPGLLEIRPRLTTLAAIGLVLIMTGATVITAEGGAVAMASIPLIIGVLAGLVAYGRRDWGWSARRSPVA